MPVRRAAALDIPKKVREAAAERDSVQGWPCCVLCGRPAPADNRLAFSCAHYISRAQGGLGTVQNIVTLCPQCHAAYDQSAARASIRPVLRRYLVSHYAGWDESRLYYRK